MRINYFVAGGFVVLIFFVIIFVTAILPATTFKPKPSAAAIVYTEQELRGYCPQVTLRENTGYYTTYEKGAEGDPDSAIYQASIAKVTRACTQSDGYLNMKVAAAGRVVAGPKGKSGTISMPIRVAVLEGDTVLYSELTRHQVQIDTTAGATQFLVTDDNVQVPIQPESKFRVYVGYDEGPYNTP